MKLPEVTKYMILLSFSLLCSMSSNTKVQPAQIEVPKAKEKGPVYHPLRAKPYTKFSMKA